MKTIQNTIKTAGLLFFFAISVSCGGSKACNAKLADKYCPADGKCTIVLHKDKAMVVNYDEFGKPNYTMQDNATKNVMVYTYNRNVPEGVQDGTYREEIIIELDKNQKSVSFDANKKSPTKALFGRFCYCKGSTGYYTIREGNLTLTDDYHMNYTMVFKITEVPQVIQKIYFSTK